MKVSEKDCINNLKMLGIDMIDKAQSGHPGIVLGCANIMYTLYAKCLKINPKDPKWVNRDRFVLSAGHGSALLYATLYMSGYDLNISDLKNFRKLNSLTPGHPEYNLTPGVDASTGPLGQGVANAVGMALAQRYYENLFNKYNTTEIENLIDYNTYVLCTDGDLMEGISYEALSFAGTQRLNKLIVLYDNNKVSLDGPTSNSFTEDVSERMVCLGFDVQEIDNDVDLIEKAIKKAKKSKLPSFISISNTIGEGSLNENTNKVHGKPLEKDDIFNLRTKLNVNNVPFTVSADILLYFQQKIAQRNNNEYIKWQDDKCEICNSNHDIKRLFNVFEDNKASFDFDIENYEVSDDYSEEIRVSNQKVMNILARKNPYFLGGSADLSSSTKTYILNEDFMSFNNPLNRNIPFGVREHAMGAILNGMSLCNLKVFGSTFLTFSDYVKPAIRMSAMQNLPVTYVFTHDSVLVGEDGPTHEPVEQLIALRSIPNLTVYRPSDINELFGVWNNIINSSNPSAVILSRDKHNKVNGTNSKLVKHGAYMVKKELKHLDAVLIASGTELEKVVHISEDLDLVGIHTRVVSMVSQELFDKESSEYKEQLIPSSAHVIAVELSTSNNYLKYTTINNIIGINDFGYSGKSIDVSEKLLVDYESLSSRIEKLIRNH